MKNEKLPVEGEHEDNKSLYNHCATEELNLLQTKYCADAHNVENLETDCFGKGECEFIEIKLVRNSHRIASIFFTCDNLLNLSICCDNQ